MIDNPPRNSLSSAKQQSNYDSRGQQRRDRIIIQTENSKIKTRASPITERNKSKQEQRSRHIRRKGQKGKLGFPDMIEGNPTQNLKNKEIQRC